MDGTFLGSDSRIPDINVRVVDECEKRGIAFAICSGRTIPALGTMRAKLSNRGYIVGANGGHVVTGDLSETIYRKTLSAEGARGILGLSRDFDAHLMVWAGDRLYVDRDDEISDYYERLSFYKKTLFDLENPEFLRKTEENGRTPVEKMFWCDSKERVDYLMEKAAPLAPADISISRSGESFVEIIDSSVNKADGLLKLCERLGISPSQMVCFGDAANDIPMLKIAGLPVAMGNAIDSVKAVSKMITDTNDNGGVWKAFCNIFGIDV